MAKNTPKPDRADKTPSVLRPQIKSSKITKGSPSKSSATKASSSTSSPTKTKLKGVKDGGTFGHNLPSRRLRYPKSGNITAIEQLVFLTETVRNHDPLNRLVQHGLDSKLFTFIVNQFRTFPKYPLSTNSACVLLQNTMRDWGHKGWTFGKCESGLFVCFQRDEDDLSFDEMDIDRDDYLEAKRKGGRNIDNIPFEALAIDVTRLPDGDDALDLTGCVIWALNNPDSGLLYPRDFQWLTEQLGGAKPVLPANRDREAFKRWNASRKAHKKLGMSASLAITKTEADYQKATTKEETSTASQAHKAAKEQLAELNTAGEALVTVDEDTTTIHQDRIPPGSAGGPDPNAVADYLEQYMASTSNISATPTEGSSPIALPSRRQQSDSPQDHDESEDEELPDHSSPHLDRDDAANAGEVVWRGEWTPSFEMGKDDPQARASPEPPKLWRNNMGTASDMDYDPDRPIDSIETDHT